MYVMSPSVNHLPSPQSAKTGWPWTEDSSVSLEVQDKALNLPRISIITPSFNQGQYIEGTIRSVLLQGYPGLEYIVIDGGSTDKSVDIIKKYAPYLTYWVSEKDAGQSDAINKGINHATGEIVGWLNSDDIYYPGALIKMGKAFQQKPHADLIYGAGAKIDENCRIIKKVYDQPYNKKRIRQKFYFLQPSMLFRRDTFLRVGGLNVSSHFAMDWELLLKISPFSNILSIPTPIAMLRRYENAKTGRPQWVVAQELANIAKKYNGIFDINYLSFYIREKIAPFKHPFVIKVVRPIVDLLFARWAGSYGYLIRLWPRRDEIEDRNALK